MSFVPRPYEAIVRDLLTTLTGGTVRESLDVPPEGVPIELAQLQHRPVRRISHLEGRIRVGAGPDAPEIPYRFTAADFELVARNGDPNARDLIRFREGGRHPVPGSKLIVNYYPVQTDPAPLTDLNIGSVIRTMMETFARELAQTEAQLEHIYKSAFLDTAENSSLDKVVALVGVTRLPAGHPVVRLRFSRRAGTPGSITVPAGTPVTDDAGNRYLTLSPVTFEPGESTREVLAGGESPATGVVRAGEIDRMEVLIAGISEVTNPQDARQLSVPETDDELRRRSRSALHGVARGTSDSLRFGLLSIPEVNTVTIVEPPDTRPGEIRIEIAYRVDNEQVRAEVQRAIDERRPAGIRVILGEVARKRVNVRVELTLAGAGASGAELAALQDGIKARLLDYLTRLPPGGHARRARLSSLALADERVVDARVVLATDAGEVEELQLAPDETLEVNPTVIFPPPASEAGPGAAPRVTARVSATLPIHLQPGITLSEASAAIHLALDGHLASRRADAPLSLDGLAAAIADPTRFVLVREDALLTVESADSRFRQLTDGVGSYAPAPNETLSKDVVDIQVREGSV